MLEPAQIENMTVDERLRAIDQLWASLESGEQTVDSPAWHGPVLQERKRKAEAGESAFMTLDQLRARLRGSTS